MKTRNYSWSDFDILVSKLLSTQLSEQKFNRILAIARGGVVLGQVLGYKLRLPVTFITCQSYDAQQKTDEVRLEKITIPGDKILAIDDILDTGDTMKEVVKTYPGIVGICTLHSKIEQRRLRLLFSQPVYIGGYIEKEIWASYPWERIAGEAA